MRQDRPHPVLLDVLMSTVLDGLNVSQEISADPNLRDIPVIMVSSIITSPHASLFPTDEYVPIDAWISKPMEPDHLLEKIGQAVGKSKPPAGPKPAGGSREERSRRSRPAASCRILT